jgi:hypothetical protein
VASALSEFGIAVAGRRRSPYPAVFESASRTSAMGSLLDSRSARPPLGERIQIWKPNRCRFSVKASAYRTFTIGA